MNYQTKESEHIRCLIVDDEPIAIRVLQAHLATVPDVTVVSTCTNALEAIRLVRTEAIDLVFLDIEMPGLTGIEFVQALERTPGIVFTTAHRDYAYAGFELDAVDYLLKPISLPRLLRAVEKYHRLRRAGHVPTPGGPGESETLDLQVDRRTVRIPLAEIRYIESLSDYVNVHTATQTYTSKLRISDLEAQLRPHGFIRIHRSFLVVVDHVTAFTARELQVGAVTLPISRSYRVDALAYLRREVH